MTKEQAARAKANWLSQCLEFGWKHSDLDNLSEVWDKFKDEYGNMRPPAPSPVSGSLEEARISAQESWNKIKEAGNDENISVVDYMAGHVDGFLAGAAYVKPDIDKVVEQMREENPYCGEIDFSEDARIAWEKSCDKLKELLNQSK